MIPREMDKLRKYINSNVARGFIQTTKSKVAAPLLFKKKDGGGEEMRVCVDSHGINVMCVENTYPLPLIKDMLSHLSKGKVFRKLDLSSGQWGDQLGT